jgi:zinc protease
MTRASRSGLRALVVVLALAVAPGAGFPMRVAAQQITPPKLVFEKYVLPNGLQVILHEDHATPVVAVNMWYHVGSKNEKRGKTGFAHLFEHMMFQGSQHHDTDWFKALEAMGATDLNGTTNSDRTNYFQTVPTHMLERTLWLEADRMGWLLPSMTQERLDNQREVVKNERRQRVDNQPFGLVQERITSALYPTNHPYSWPVIGYMEDLTAASKSDVEEFFKQYYGPNNATLVIAGDIDPAKTKALVEKYFGSIPPGPPVGRAKEWIPELDRELRLEMNDRISLPRIYVVWPAPGRFTEAEARLDVLAGALAGGKSSRLYKRLVYDMKVAQDVSAFHGGSEISGTFNVTVTAAPGHSLDEIEPVIREEIEKIKSQGPTADEVERERTGILAGFLRGLERIGGFGGKSDLLATYNTFLGDPNYVEKDFARYQAVTPAAAQAAANRWLGNGRIVMRVEPFGSPVAIKDGAGFDRAAMPGPGTLAAATPPKIQRAKLSNGLSVMLAEVHKVPVVNFNLVVGGGRSADRKEKPGVASFAAGMLPEGTKTRTAFQIDEESQKLGANLSAGASLDSFTISLNALKARLEPSLALWADLALNPAFPADEVERKRQQTLGRIAQEKQNPNSVAARLLPALLYGPDHPYGQPLTGTGTEASVKALTRDDLVAYHQTWVKPNNATLVVVGDTTLAEITPMLEKAFAGWKPGDVPKVVVPERPQPAKTAIYLVDKPGAAQSVIMAAHLSPAFSDPDTVAFDVLNTALGGQFTSRINMNLREEKGYTYGARTRTFDARAQGAFIFSSQVRTDVTKESVAEVLKELRDIRGTRPLTADELRAAQSNLMLSLPGTYETIGGVAGKLVEIATYGLPDDYYGTYPTKVGATTSQALTTLAGKRILPENLVVLVVGDRAVVEPKLRELNLGSIQILDVDGKVLAGQ